jgi:hypothetical protein
MEPPTTVPRLATTLTRLWQRTDAADSIAQFLPTEALPVLPNIAKTFERDHWRLLGALMRRAKRGTAAACKSAVLSTLLLSRDPVHLREDWADQARFTEKWTVFGIGGGSEGVEYTARVSQGTLVMDRLSPQSSTSLASRFDIPGAGDRCCIHQFRVALTYTANNEWGGKTGCGFHLLNFADETEPIRLLLVYIHYANGSYHLRLWPGGDNDDIHTLKTVPTQHTFLVDATLDWRTGMARVTVDGAEIDWLVPFPRVPVTTVYLKSGEHPGQNTFGPVDVWYSIMPPPIPSARFEGDP